MGDVVSRVVHGADLTGARFGKLTVLGPGAVVRSNRRWVCACDCGGSSEPYGFGLKNGTTTSCGCVGRERLTLRTTHGGSRSVEHRLGGSMCQRCSNPKHPSYEYYGGAGVTVDQRWLGKEGFANFLADMGRRPSASHSLDRVNSKFGYSPRNCKWSTRVEQNNNTSRNKFLLFDGRRQTVAQWAVELGLHYNTLTKRLKSGWPVRKALTTPADKRHSRSCAHTS